MESRILLVLLASVALSNAELPCIEGNCTEPDFSTILRFGINLNQPDDSNSNKNENDFFNDIAHALINKEESPFDDAIDPRVAESKDDPPQGLLLIRIKQFVVFPNEDNMDNSDKLEPQIPLGLRMFSLNKMLEEIGILDLSGKSMTGDELASLLSQHPFPVTSLVLSNTRIQDLTPDSFSPVQDTLQMLKMDNSSVSLQALSQLNNLKFLNLSHNGLSTFEWFPQLSDSLEVLDLSYNHFREVRPELSILTSLKELYLSNNWISSVPKEPLAKLQSLEVLNLSMNSIENANLADLSNLQEVDLDWNYLRLMGNNLILPAHRLSVRLASNPWRCDCGMLNARDSYDVLDLDTLQCADRQVFTLCDDCQRYFLPMEDGLLVSNLTVDSIEHLGCTGISDQFYLIRKDLILMRDHEPEKLVRMALFLVSAVLILVAAVMMCRNISRKKFDKQAWLKIQEIPYLKINKLGKPQDIPYVKIDPSNVKI